MKTCIICRTEKKEDLFNEEHIFPAAMGGCMIINSVCSECNEKMGREIDEHLSSHHLISLIRQKYNITRADNSKRKGIPNPFAGKYTDKETGEDFTVQFENGHMVSRILPVFEPPIKHAEDNYECKIHIDGAFAHRIDDFVESYLRKYPELKGRKVIKGDIKATENKPRTIEVMISHNPIILGSLKISYELAITLIPKYYTDPRAEIFASILSDPTLANQYKYLFDEGPLQTEMKEAILSIEGQEPWQHIAVLTSIKGKGLVCALRLFNVAYAVHLSDKEYPLPFPILIVNDAKQHQFITNLNTPVTLRLTTFKLMLNLLPQQIEAIKKYGESGFRTIDGLTSIYDQDGIKIYDHLEEASDVKKLRLDNYNEQINGFEVLHTFEEPRFVKLHITGELFHLKEVIFVYVIQTP